MREVCKVVALTYQELEKKIRPGMSTWELDQIAEQDNDFFIKFDTSSDTSD